jgi:bud emergence protein 1
MPIGNHDSGYGTGLSANGARMSKSMGRNAGAMVYGVVMYDFKAERPDELDAKAGEAIIVIAQSNPEWFVAKPITRLGGPGLIPVSFIEIRDMATNTPVEDPQEAVRRAGVPKVEEWKKMAADYKNGSIPLGKLDSGAQSIQQGMARLSMGNKPPQEQMPAYGNPNDYASQVRCLSLVMIWSSNFVQPGMIDGAQYQSNPYGMQQPQSQSLLAPMQASVPRYCFADDTFWFIVVVEMEDGRWWELQRLYQDFYDLQINLITEFPREAGNYKGVERSLPYMPGPVTYVTDNISNGRRANLNEYVRQLLKLGPHITRGYRVRKFFAPREGDYEIDPAVADPYRISTGSQIEGQQPNVLTPQSSFSGPTTMTPQSQPDYNQQPNAPRVSQPGHMRNMSGAASIAPGYGGQQATLVKIKVWLGPDNCVVIRMQPDFTYSDLVNKLQERLRLEPGFANEPHDTQLEVLYRDESDNKLYEMRNDMDLKMAMQRNSKLTLDVRSVS